MKLQKAVRTISYILLGGVMLLSACLAGMYNERERVKQEEQAETVDNIAVVNLDRGIYENNAVKYYSQELMNLEADNLVSESLEAARQGINNGNYAAYVIIPAEFSENAVSLNSVPQKATLEFAVNPNLREDVSRLTMSNIKNFEINLNTNMSYMYVQAILKEFHEVQDSSGIIMKNDDEELARIMGIEPGTLMTSPDPLSPEWANPDIEDVDFDQEFKVNSEISTALRDEYDEFVLQGEEAFELIKAGEEVVIESLDLFLDAMMEIDIETDADGNVVYEQGIADMSEYLEKYEAEFSEQKNKIFNRIDAVVMVTPVPTPTVSPEESLTPTVSPEEIPTPAVSPSESPSPAGGLLESPTPTIDPVETPVPTVTPTPEIKSIPLIIKETIDGSLQIANEKIEEHNKNDENVIQEIRQTLGEIRELLGAPQRVYLFDEPPLAGMDREEKEETCGNDGEEAEGEEPGGDDNWDEPEAYRETSEEEIIEQTVYEEILGAGNQVQEILDYLDFLEEMTDQIEKLDKMLVEEIYDEETIKEEFRNLAMEIEELPELNVEEYQGIFEGSILQPLQEEIMNENLKIQEEGSKYMEVQSEYIEELGLFDPYEYYDYEKMDEMTAAFAENIFNLEEKVFNSQTGYLELVYDTVDLSNESMEAMSENLSNAYDGTREKIETEVDLAKQYREEINETNIGILGDFKEKLPYTRIGNLEYVQAYDFMVKPIRMFDNSVIKKRTSFWQDYDVLKNVLIALLMIWSLSVLVQMGIKLYEDKREDFDKE